MHLMDHLNAIARQHQADQEAARQATAAGPAGPPVLKAPIVSGWLLAGAIIGFALAYISIQHLVFAVVCGVLTAVVFRLAQGILRGLGITSGAGALNRGLGGVPQWMLGGAFMGALVGAGFMVWLDGMAADIVAPAMAAAPVGAVAGLVIRGLTLLLAGGRRA